MNPKQRHNTTHLILLLLMCLTGAHALAQQPAQDVLQVHPAQLSRTQPFLIEINHYWPDLCGGRFETQVSTSSIDITAISISSFGAVCAAAIQPFTRLFNAQTLMEEPIEFDETVRLRFYQQIADVPPRLISERLVIFSEQPNAPAHIQSGSWISTDLQNSGLFIDQQDSLITAGLMDFNQQGDPMWAFSAGSLNGNVLIATMHQYVEHEVCTIGGDCTRATPVNQGQILLLMRNYNEIVVQYENVLSSTLIDNESAKIYQRLNLVRPSQLPDFNGQPAPNLLGQWIITAQLPERTVSQAVNLEYSHSETTGVVKTLHYTLTSELQSEAQFTCLRSQADDRGGVCEMSQVQIDALQCSWDVQLQDIGVTRASGSGECDGEPARITLLKL